MAQPVMIVRHTFLEFLGAPVEGARGRRRTMSDTEFLLPETPTSQASGAAEKDLDDVMSNVSTRAADTSEDEAESPAGEETVRRSPSLCWADESEDDAVEIEKTTVMLRNVPYNVSRDAVVKMMDDAGFNGLYDFIYLPIDFRSKSGFGYAFINMTSNAAALKFFEHFNGFTEWPMKSQKVAEVTWSEPSQGLDIHVDRYRSSPVMHEVVPDEFKPAMYSGGLRVPFPVPLKAIRAPRFRRR